MTQITYTRATFITGNDARGNEHFYFKTLEGGWWDGYNECPTTKLYMANYIIPSIVKVRFGDLEVTRDEWLMAGCPYELTNVEIAGWMECKPEFDEAAAVQLAQRLAFEQMVYSPQLPIKTGDVSFVLFAAIDKLDNDYQDLINTQEDARF